MKAHIQKRAGRWVVRIAPDYLIQHAAAICAEMNAQEDEGRSATYLDRLRKELLAQQLRSFSRVILGYDEAGPYKDLTVIAARPTGGNYIMGRELRVCPGLPDEKLLFTDGHLFANELTLTKIVETLRAGEQILPRDAMR